MTPRHLEASRVLVTGAGSNVGRAVCALFSRHGARLALADMDAGRAAASAAAAEGDAAPLVLQADLTRAGDCERMAEEALSRLGGIDVLCNTAGIDPPGAGRAHETREADWDRILEVNLKGVFLACKALLPAMIAQRSGAIVNVASQGALLAMPAMAAYGVSKAGVLQLTRQIAADYARDGIRANCVCPSGLETPSRDRLAALGAEALERRAEAMRRAAPLGRVCTPADVAWAMLFLASPMSQFITGAALPVEGGATTALKF
jgi:NAD(P)-dependent dehydrogenase (short-subunit alcohol dehydrogenase family)